MPDDELEDELRRLFAQLIERTPPLQTLELDAHHPRFGTKRLWRIRTRRTWIAGVAAIAGLAVVLAFVLPTSPGIVSDSRLGLSISGAAVTATPAPGVTFSVSYLPSGFHLLSATRVTNAVSPANSAQESTYGRGDALGSGAGKIIVAIEPIPTGSSPETTLGPGSRSIAGPVIGGTRSVFVSRPPTSQIPVSGPCSVFERSGSVEIASQELAWTVPSSTQGVSFVVDVMYEGKVPLSEEDIVRVAQGVRFDASSWSCWTVQSGLLRQSSSSAACTPGQAGALANHPSLAGGSVIARGSLYGTPWELVVATATCHPTKEDARGSATAFGLVADNGLSCGPFIGTTAEFHQSEANIVVENLPNGQRVACGSVPPVVSSVTITSSEGPGVSEPVLPTQRVGSSFFVMSLGKVGSTCYFVCKGSITVKLYSGPKLLSSHEWQEPATETNGQSYGVKS